MSRKIMDGIDGNLGNSSGNASLGEKSDSLSVMQARRARLEGGRLQQVFGTVRPVFILVAAWAMATSQVLRKHTATLTRYNAFLLLPAYHLFYQAFLISALFFMYQRHIEKMIELGAMTCSDYKVDTRSRFGFIKNPTVVYHFTLKALIVFVVSTVAGLVAAHIIKNGEWRPRSLAEYRRTFAYYSCANIGLCILTYFAATIVFAEHVPAEEWTEIECKMTDEMYS